MSHNTSRFNVDEVIEKILTTDYVKAKMDDYK